ncbi:MAG: hypothetical protein Q8P11_02195 [bacterium]|nr:hypothetical protein [bacterium]
MKTVYYYDQTLKICPVKQYLSQYKIKAKLLAEIDQKINHIIQSNGLPTPPISKPLQRIRDYKTLSKRIQK